jgi:hypothetical protein
MTVEVHAEEERVRGVNLNGGRAGGMDLDGRRAGGLDLDDGGDATSRRTWRRSGRRGAHVEVVGVVLRQTLRRSVHRRVYGGEMIGLWFRGLAHLKRRIVVMGGVDYINTPITKVE